MNKYGNKLALYGTNGRLFATDGPCQVQSHVTHKLGQISKIWPNQTWILCHSLRIRGQLPAPIVNGGGDSCWKCRASPINLYLHAKFHWNRRNFLWPDGWTYSRTDGHLRPALLGRLSKSRPKNCHGTSSPTWQTAIRMEVVVAVYRSDVPHTIQPGVSKDCMEQVQCPRQSTSESITSYRPLTTVS